MQRFGWQQPIVAKMDGEVIAGNTRLKAAKSLGMTHVPVVRFDGDNLEATAFAVADNRTAEFADWDDTALASILEELRNEDALAGVGYESEDIDRLIEEIAREQGTVEDDGGGPPPAEPVTRPGDLWICGSHKVLCGDSTKAEDVARLLEGVRPNLMVTDPPYGVEYDPAWRQEAADKGLPGFHPSRLGKVENDDRADWGEAWALFPGDVVYAWSPAGRDSIGHFASVEASGFEVRYQIIWAKPSFAISRGHYNWQHEPCWYAVRKGSTASWIGDHSQTSLWEVSRPADIGTNHGTEKPIECMARPIRNHEGDVYDPFLGSGTTLIAAHQLGRKCYGIEIAPAYVDVAVRRWEKASGLTAHLAGTDQTLDDVAAERGRK